MSDLRDDLTAALVANGTIEVCQACDALAKAPDPETKALLSDALAGTIGTSKLSLILRKHGYEVGRRVITRHRTERHGS